MVVSFPHHPFIISRKESFANKPTYDHFTMQDQWNRVLVFRTDGSTFTREWLNAPPKTNPQHLAKVVSMTVYAIAWLSFCQQGGLFGNATTTHTQPDEYNPAQADLDAYFDQRLPATRKAA